MQLEIKTTIDAFNPNQVKALNDFLVAIGSTSQNGASTTGEIQPEEKPKQLRKRAEKVTEAPQEDAPQEDAPQEDAPQEDAPQEEAISAPTLMQIRSLVAQKAGEHKDTIKAKLIELGAQNVSTLDAKHFNTIFTFLNEL